MEPPFRGSPLSTFFYGVDFYRYFIYPFSYEYTRTYNELTKSRARIKKKRCEWSQSDQEGDKWSKRHDVIKDMVIDIVYEDYK